MNKEFNDKEMMKETTTYLDMEKVWIVTALKTEVYHVPVSAISQEQAIEKANLSMDFRGQETFKDNFYFEDVWEFEAHINE